MTDLGEIIEIELHRGEKGLGFNIRGGKDNPYLDEDTGIFVVKIREDGAAAQDGRLQDGDKIVEINGNSLVDVNHSVAVNHFLDAGDAVTLKVLSGAETKITERTEARRIEKSDESSSRIGQVILLAGAVGALGASVYFAYRYLKHR